MNTRRKWSSVKEFHIINENTVVCSRRVPSVFINKPIYIGVAILETSKLTMYKYHYDYVVPKYGPRAKLLFTDTDSLTYHIETEDVYKDI